jgi:cystathionine gamma-synthase
VQGAAVAKPPVLSTSYFTHPDAVGFSATDLKADAPHFYSRWSNPTLDVLERRLALLEGGEAAVSFASGMAAIVTLFHDRLQAGDHLVLSNVCYAGVSEYAHHVLPRHGVSVTAVDTTNPEAVAAAMRPNTRLVHIETPANPILRITDIAAIAKVAHAGGAELSVDSTIATPIAHAADRTRRRLCLPLADQVPLRPRRRAGRRGDRPGRPHGGTAPRRADPHGRSAVAVLGLPDPARHGDAGAAHGAARSQCAEACRVSVGHTKVRGVNWPGLRGHPGHEIARRADAQFFGPPQFFGEGRRGRDGAAAG